MSGPALNHRGDRQQPAVAEVHPVGGDGSAVVPKLVEQARTIVAKNDPTLVLPNRQGWVARVTGLVHARVSSRQRTWRTNPIEQPPGQRIPKQSRGFASS